jgi:hypothetical protein
MSTCIAVVVRRMSEQTCMHVNTGIDPLMPRVSWPTESVAKSSKISSVTAIVWIYIYIIYRLYTRRNVGVYIFKCMIFYVYFNVHVLHVERWDDVDWAQTVPQTGARDRPDVGSARLFPFVAIRISQFRVKRWPLGDRFFILPLKLQRPSHRDRTVDDM